MSVVYFHRTTVEAAEAIQRGGFRDGTGRYMTAEVHCGVWLSDRPLDVNEGADGDVLLSVTLPDDLDLSAFEWVQDVGYREWLVPAAIINPVMLLKIVQEDYE